ncbi:MAG TPA: hypothetical protein PLL10_02115 [Elusimicrobiales bacterium]|nr:hypothetical protein [Elusimicrobiales bacterium]
MAEERDLPVLHTQPPGHAPRAIVFAGDSRPLAPAEAKRARFVRNLKNNYARLNEALAFFEYFAGICELSLERRESIRKANKEAIEELGRKLTEKLAEYDKRLKEGA